MIAVSSKILHLTAVSFQPSPSDDGDPVLLDVVEDVELKSKSLSSVLHKLHLWEKKLYEEVKVHLLSPPFISCPSLTASSSLPRYNILCFCTFLAVVV